MNRNYVNLGYPRFSRGLSDRQRTKSHHFRLETTFTNQEFNNFLQYLDTQFMPSVLNWAATGRGTWKNYNMVITTDSLTSTDEMTRHFGPDIGVYPIFGSRQLQYFLQRVWEESGNEIQEIRFSQGPSPGFELSEDEY